MAEHILEGGGIDWPQTGHYRLRVDQGSQGAAPKLIVTCQTIQASFEVPAEMLEDDAGPWTLVENWSLENASIQGPKAKYICQNFFPMLARQRTLKRQVSDEVQALAAIGVEVAQAKGGGGLKRAASMVSLASQSAEPMAKTVKVGATAAVAESGEEAALAALPAVAAALDDPPPPAAE